MPSVFLSDDEVVDLILDRPHLIPEAFARLQKEIEEDGESMSNMYRIISDLRKEVKELKKTVDTP